MQRTLDQRLYRLNCFFSNFPLRPLNHSSLEQALRNFTCLTAGDIIEISYNSMVLDFLIMDVQPAGTGISVVDTDIEVRRRITMHGLGRKGRFM